MHLKHSCVYPLIRLTWCVAAGAVSSSRVGVRVRRWARLSVVSVVAVWALLVGTAVSDPAAAVSAEERVSAESTGVEELPALPSDPVPAEEPSVPAGDAGEVGSLPAPAVADMTVPVGAASLSRHGAVDRGGLRLRMVRGCGGFRRIR